jgi:hypothetical protein
LGPQDHAFTFGGQGRDAASAGRKRRPRLGSDVGLHGFAQGFDEAALARVAAAVGRRPNQLDFCGAAQKGVQGREGGGLFVSRARRPLKAWQGFTQLGAEPQ